MKKISLCLSIILCFVGLFLFLYTLYKFDFKFNLLNSDHRTKYYFIGIALFIFGIAVLFIEPEYNKNFAIVLISVFIAFYFCEATLYFLDSKKAAIPKTVLEQNPDYDQRSRFEVFSDEVKKHGKGNVSSPPVPAILASENNSELLILGGHSNIRTVFCNELGFYIIYKSDRYGFRNPDQEWNENKNVEYLIVGDSLAHGMCVNENDTISGWLRNNNKNRNAVINLGMWADGPLLMYAKLREYLAISKAKNVLWLHSEGNDFTDLNHEKKSSILNKYLKDKKFSQNLANKQNKIDEIVVDLIENNKVKGQDNSFYKKNFKNNIMLFLKLTRLRTLTIDKPQVQMQPLIENMQLFKEIIISAKNLTEENNAKFFFVDLPDLFARKYSGQKNLLFNEKKIATQMTKEFLQLNKIPYIDIYGLVFEKHDDPMSLFPFRGYGHFNPDGYKNSAKAIKNFIENKK